MIRLFQSQKVMLWVKTDRACVRWGGLGLAIPLEKRVSFPTVANSITYSDHLHRRLIMRIRLVINRNGLPSMKIWWDTSSFQPGDDKTVSSLLARVSQIVPLESSKWGLEDYAVEIEGFEILHFQEVETVIREADEVVYVCPKFLGWQWADT